MLNKQEAKKWFRHGFDLGICTENPYPYEETFNKLWKKFGKEEKINFADRESGLAQGYVPERIRNIETGEIFLLVQGKRKQNKFYYTGNFSENGHIFFYTAFFPLGEKVYTIENWCIFEEPEDDNFLEKT
jgi:hypothetical protein